ncbi:MAG: PAS domain S-box protein, partial [Pseudomonadota bacterium]
MADARDTFVAISESDRLHAILDAAACAIITIDTDGIIRFANKGTEKLFGHRPEAVLGKTVGLLMPADVAREHDAYIAHHVRTGKARVLGMSRNIRGLHADGTSFPVHISVGVIERDGICGYTAVISDQSALEVTQTRLSAAIDGIGDGFALFDAKGRLAVSNAAHKALLQLPADACKPGTMLREHMKSLGPATHFIVEGDDSAAGDKQTRERRVELGGGRTVSIRRSFLENADMIITTRDETALVRNNALVNRAERLRSLGELTGGVAHDFNNMLAVIIGNLELLQPHMGDEDAADMLAEALEAAELGARLTDRLLAFARRQPLDVKPVAINDMVLDTVALLKRTLGVDIELTLDLAPKLPPVTADRSQLESG